MYALPLQSSDSRRLPTRQQGGNDSEERKEKVLYRVCTRNYDLN